MIYDLILTPLVVKIYREYNQNVKVNVDISRLRKEYSEKPFDLSDIKENPFDQFQIWFEEVMKADISEPNAMILATATQSARPSSRTVLLKKFDSEGFVFFTNYLSRKAHQLGENPHASLTFLWKEIERQVCIEGSVEKTTPQVSASYFAIRPRRSQLSAWASHQSEIIASRKQLEDEYYRLETLYKDQEIPTPPFWGGFKIIPARFEFWQGRRDRLHDRFEYTKTEENWKIARISP